MPLHETSFNVSTKSIFLQPTWYGIINRDFAEKFVRSMPRTPPPLKTVFQQRREREFLYLHEIDAVIAAMSQTRYPTRNKAIALLLFCQWFTAIRAMLAALV
ncbi:hypothetical protein [Chroococcidiopsis cubana]|uniref:hypothetical protein n=1 Tax=Chroococcidiopsis cubana TaxID=171392 RepID=UPI001F54044B|nr:hypothetical protein [Chroococcidiopsis cubana]